jgi:aldose 1-epimerase
VTVAGSLRLGGGEGELEVRLALLGARLTSVRVPWGDGRREVTVGLGADAAYLASDTYQGATVGRYANRIGHGDLPLDGTSHRLPTNDRGHTLHGGPVGFDRRTWSLVESDRHRAVLELVSPDGDQGFPGTLRVRAEWEVSGPTLRTTYEAVTDAPTVVSLSSHPYFRLADEVGRHLLRVEADRYLPTDDTGLPTGSTAVAGSAYDLRAAAPVDPGFDHCWVLRGEGMRTVAELEGGGLLLTLATDQPGLQVYAGGGRVAGVALEPQHLPDAPHHPEWPSPVLRPGGTYRWCSEMSVGPRP